MRRTLLGLLCAVLLTAALVAPASAGTVLTVRGLESLNQGSVGLLSQSCTDPLAGFDGTTNASVVAGSIGAHLGAHAFGWHPSKAGAFVGPALTTTRPSQVSTFRVDHYGPSTGVAYAQYQPPAGGAGGYWVGLAQVASAGTGWHTADEAATTYDWWHVTDGTAVVEPSDTLQHLVASQGGDGPTVLGIGFGCDGQQFYLDKLQVGSAASVTTVDLEADAPSIAMRGLSSRILVGGATTLLGTPSTGPADRLTLQLQAETYGATRFSAVGSTSTGNPSPADPARYVVRPTKRTVYRWVLPASASHGQAVSASFVVNVVSRLTAKLVKATVRKGRQLAVTGRSTPAKAHAVVALQRQVGRRWKTLSSARTSKYGVYRLAVKAKARGSWRLRVVGAAGTGNLAGTSPVVTARVK